MTQRRIYQTEYPYFITFRTREAYPLFDEVKYARLMARVIFKTCNIKRYDVIAFQIMPDHVHILTYNKNRQAHPAAGALHYKNGSAGTAACARVHLFTISELMHGIKSYFAHQLYKKYSINFSVQQIRFHTRIVNTTEYLYSAIEYIKRNPIKAKLPDTFQQPPYRYINLINY